LNNEFRNNTINSSISNSYGYHTFSGENSIENTTISGGNVNVGGLDLYFSNKNNNVNGELTINNVNFSGEIVFRNINDTTIQNSSYQNITIIDCNPILINNN
ncbi:MAG: hypothetical protein QM478_07450, partial [Flavobacteriaceae bacterium]